MPVQASNFKAEVATLLANKDVDPACYRNEPLQIASECGSLPIVRLLLELPTVNAADNACRALRLAAEKGHVEVVRLLLNQKMKFLLKRHSEVEKLTSN